jgi:hypothetical protein
MHVDTIDRSNQCPTDIDTARIKVEAILEMLTIRTLFKYHPNNAWKILKNYEFKCEKIFNILLIGNKTFCVCVCVLNDFPQNCDERYFKGRNQDTYLRRANSNSKVLVPYNYDPSFYQRPISFWIIHLF